ncbi:PE-PGRS family protein PE_PGRS16 [Mycobacterium tuberculosis]|nr:PE-PGRS family protein PE_PGRS16 [Mycobacterium tuberculosis]
MTNATVPLQLVNTTEPVVFISLNGGQMVPVLLDTGSTGLVMDSQFLTQNFGPVIGTGTAGYAGGLTYNYNTYSTTVDFGNGLLTLPTSVNVVTSSSPGTLGNFLSRSGAVGVLGIGPNNGFPGTSSIVTAMPGLLNNGVLIDESAGILQFGPNTLTGGITISGAPISTVAVQIDNGPLQQAPVMFDSGGINGTIPSALASLPSGGFVPAGTTISVYTSDGQTLLYSYTTTATNTPFVTSGGVMNTGHVPFAQQPIYVSYSPPPSGRPPLTDGPSLARDREGASAAGVLDCRRAHLRAEAHTKEEGPPWLCPRAESRARTPEAGARSGGPGRTGAGRTHRAGWCQLITDTVSPAKLVT